MTCDHYYESSMFGLDCDVEDVNQISQDVYTDISRFIDIVIAGLKASNVEIEEFASYLDNHRNVYRQKRRNELFRLRLSIRDKLKEAGFDSTAFKQDEHTELIDHDLYVEHLFRLSLGANTNTNKAECEVKVNGEYITVNKMEEVGMIGNKYKLGCVNGWLRSVDNLRVNGSRIPDPKSSAEYISATEECLNLIASKFDVTFPPVMLASYLSSYDEKIRTSVDDLIALWVKYRAEKDLGEYNPKAQAFYDCINAAVRNRIISNFASNCVEFCEEFEDFDEV